jgi:hypothetical protein
MTLHLRWAAVTDQGHVRSNNQDAYYAGDRLLVVADGMGGMAAGDVASRLAVDAMTSLDVAIDNEHQMDALHKALEVANGKIAETVAGDAALQGMGTTMTAVIFSGDRAALAHVGDSRAYLLRDGRLNQLTKDDTYVQMLVDQGLIRPEEAGSHPRRPHDRRVRGHHRGRDARPARPAGVRAAAARARAAGRRPGQHHRHRRRPDRRRVAAAPHAFDPRRRLRYLTPVAEGRIRGSAAGGDDDDGTAPHGPAADHARPGRRRGRRR